MGDQLQQGERPGNIEETQPDAQTATLAGRFRRRFGSKATALVLSGGVLAGGGSFAAGYFLSSQDNPEARTATAPQFPGSTEDGETAQGVEVNAGNMEQASYDEALRTANEIIDYMAAAGNIQTTDSSIQSWGFEATGSGSDNVSAEVYAPRTSARSINSEIAFDLQISNNAGIPTHNLMVNFERKDGGEMPTYGSFNELAEDFRASSSDYRMLTLTAGIADVAADRAEGGLVRRSVLDGDILQATDNMNFPAGMDPRATPETMGAALENIVEQREVILGEARDTA